MKGVPYCEANTRLSIQKFHHLLWHLKFHYSFHKNKLLFLNLSHLNMIYIFILYLLISSLISSSDPFVRLPGDFVRSAF